MILETLLKILNSIFQANISSTIYAHGPNYENYIRNINHTNTNPENLTKFTLNISAVKYFMSQIINKNILIPCYERYIPRVIYHVYIILDDK